MDNMETCIILGAPIIFLILFIKNIVGIVKAKKNKDTVKKSLIIKSIIFGIIFLLIVIYYGWVMYLLFSILTNPNLRYLE